MFSSSFQDPLVEFAQLTGPENEILCLRYHTYQDLVSLLSWPLKKLKGVNTGLFVIILVFS